MLDDSNSKKYIRLKPQIFVSVINALRLAPIGEEYRGSRGGHHAYGETRKGGVAAIIAAGVGGRDPPEKMVVQIQKVGHDTLDFFHLSPPQVGGQLLMKKIRQYLFMSMNIYYIYNYRTKTKQRLNKPPHTNGINEPEGRARNGL